jgi:hypothetical protein
MSRRDQPGTGFSAKLFRGQLSAQLLLPRSQRCSPILLRATSGQGLPRAPDPNGPLVTRGAGSVVVGGGEPSPPRARPNLPRKVANDYAPFPLQHSRSTASRRLRGPEFEVEVDLGLPPSLSGEPMLRALLALVRGNRQYLPATQVCLWPAVCHSSYPFGRN